MDRRLGLVATVVFVALLLGCAPMPVVQEKARASIQSESRVLVTKIIEAYRSLIYTTDQQCGNADCLVPITLSFVPVEGKEVCIATFPEALVFTNSAGGGPKVITWKINTGGRLIEFHTAHGILVVDDAKSQIKPDNVRTDPVTFSATNKHNQQGSATYVPVILFRPTPTESAHVCATGDPQIINN